MMFFSALFFLHATEVFPLGFIGMMKPMVHLKLGRKINKYQASPLVEKAASVTKPTFNFEVSSTESVTTGLMVRHKSKAPTAVRPSRNS